MKTDISEEELEALAKMLKIVEGKIPFSRIEVPQHLIDRYNEKTGECLNSMALTVTKGHQPSEEEIWNMMLDMKMYAKHADKSVTLKRS